MKFMFIHIITNTVFEIMNFKQNTTTSYLHIIHNHTNNLNVIHHMYHEVHVYLPQTNDRVLKNTTPIL